MRTNVINRPATARVRRALRLREAVVGLFSDHPHESLEELRQFTQRDWQRNLRWLDGGGMALYLIDRLIQLKAEDILPSSVQARLKQNLADNRNRTASLFDEMCAINRGFEELGMAFANLKGMTLCPDSVPDAALRNQLDLDFLAASDQSAQAEKVMASMGYHLHAIEHGTWEFKAGASSMPSVKDLYKARPQRSAEIHFVDRNEDADNQEDQGPSTRIAQLQRAQVRSVCGTPMPVLPPADQILNQALHLFSHLRSEFTRPSWALEFARHLRTHRENLALWQEVRELADEIPQANIALGLSILLVEDMFGPCAPPVLRHWTVDALSEPVTLWASLYGRLALLEQYPGNKFYLLLEDALAGDTPRKRISLRSKLLPHRMPQMVTQSTPGETIAITLGRYKAQVSHLRFRLRFHLVEGLRYSLEAPRWRRLKKVLSNKQATLLERPS